jgi:hypothetical protein
MAAFEIEAMVFTDSLEAAQGEGPRDPGAPFLCRGARSLGGFLVIRQLLPIDLRGRQRDLQL